MVSKKDGQGDNNYISLFKTKILKDTANWDNKEQKEGKMGGTSPVTKFLKIISALLGIYPIPHMTPA